MTFGMCICGYFCYTLVAKSNLCCICDGYEPEYCEACEKRRPIIIGKIEQETEQEIVQETEQEIVQETEQEIVQEIKEMIDGIAFLEKKQPKLLTNEEFQEKTGDFNVKFLSMGDGRIMMDFKFPENEIFHFYLFKSEIKIKELIKVLKML